MLLWILEYNPVIGQKRAIVGLADGIVRPKTLSFINLMIYIGMVKHLT